MDDIIEAIALFVFEYIVDPFLERSINRKFRTWSKNLWTGWLLGLLFVLFLLMLFWWGKIESAILVIVSLIGAGLSGDALFRYAIWRHKKGRDE